ncbi:short-chain dehydrogenase/reductase [Dictyobacter alpinus]|uniref:Short-chain dehydrogenase/reductase n=1 Tax=Dictyobacter alpinus TaxID=2014873 RepID=A0A402BJR9_9CHLR|nr:SDR family oxidoreductase [Dictyobacter alpinus]GCE31585.1 short-chain dehydrogenase/reductase [Dictyobacter alpinus]
MSTQTILVTGSSSGFGFLLTQRLLTQGYTVFATMRQLEGYNAEPAGQLRRYAQDQPGSLHLLELDVTDESSVTAAVDQVLQQAGRLDVVINNAGIGGGGYTEAFSVAQFQQTFDVNVFAIQRMMRAVLPAMRTQRSGLIITISSLQGRIVIPFAGAYTASKFAVEGLCESYHYELAPSGVDVVIVEPGGFPTDYWSKMMKPADQARTDGYAPDGDLPDQLWNGVKANLQSQQAPDAQVLVSAVLQLIETPVGQRPLRTVVDPLMGGGAPTAVNQTTEPIQRELLQALGLGERITVQGAGH